MNMIPAAKMCQRIKSSSWLNLQKVGLYVMFSFLAMAKVEEIRYGKRHPLDAVLHICGEHSIRGRAPVDLQSFSIQQPKVWGLLLFPASS